MSVIGMLLSTRAAEVFFENIIWIKQRKCIIVAYFSLSGSNVYHSTFISLSCKRLACGEFS